MAEGRNPKQNRYNYNNSRDNNNTNNYNRYNNNNNSSYSNSSPASLYDATLYNFFEGTKYSSDYGYSSDVVTYTLSNGQIKKISKSVVDIIAMIFNEDEMKKIIRDYSLDPAIIESNQFTSDIILKGLTELSTLGITICNTIVNDNKGGKKNVPPSSSYSSSSSSTSFNSNKDSFMEFIKMIPFIQQPIIQTTKQISYYSHGLNDILLIKDAYNIIKENQQDPNFFYKYYKALQTKIRPIEKNGDEYNKVLQYVINSHGPTHSDFKLEVIEIFKISRRGEFRKYKHFKENYGLPKLVWHGTRATNIPSVLLNGLKIAPQQAPSIGNMFGKGIYFTDCVSKAAKNCHVDPNKPYGLLLLAEVALGKTLKLTKGEDITFLRNGKHSVKGLGKYEPDQANHLLTKSGVQVPHGKQIQNANIKSELNYNEYVVYNPNQILLQYLVKVKFHFK